MKNIFLILLVIGLAACGTSKKTSKDVPYKNPSARYLGN